MLETIALLFVLYMMAHLMPFPLLRHMRSMGQANDAEKRDASTTSNGPTPIDIVVVQIMLTRAKRLPPDIVDAIFDHAEYWAHSTNEIDFMVEHKHPLRINGTSATEDKFLVRPVPLDPCSILANDLTAPLVSRRPHGHCRRQEPRRGARLRHQRSETPPTYKRARCQVLRQAGQLPDAENRQPRAQDRLHIQEQGPGLGEHEGEPRDVHRFVDLVRGRFGEVRCQPDL